MWININLKVWFDCIKTHTSLKGYWVSRSGESNDHQSKWYDHEGQVEDESCHVEPERPLGIGSGLHVLPHQLASPWLQTHTYTHTHTHTHTHHIHYTQSQRRVTKWLCTDILLHATVAHTPSWKSRELGWDRGRQGNWAELHTEPSWWWSAHSGHELETWQQRWEGHFDAGVYVNR